MSVLNQKTINQDITFDGIGLHSGLAVNYDCKACCAKYWNNF